VKRRALSRLPAFFFARAGRERQAIVKDKVKPPRSGEPSAADERLTLHGSALVEGMVAKLLDFFGDPRGGPMLNGSEAHWIDSGAIQRAVDLCSHSKRNR
jgi:hypothetical protein